MSCTVTSERSACHAACYRAIMARPRKSSPLRERLTQTTRDVILDAVVVQLGEAGPFDFSYFEVARRSGVAVRTIYRHFPTRDDLFDALSRRVNRAVGFEYPRTREALAGLVRGLFPAFERHAAVINAQMLGGLSRVRARSRSKRAGMMQEVLGAALPHLPAERLRAVAGLFTCMISATTWTRLRDEHGLDPAAGGEVTAWAIDALWRALEVEDDRARKANR